MENITVYIHGQGGNAAEAEHYKPLFKESDVVGFDYASRTPWEAKNEFPKYFEAITADFDKVTLIANSIGAFFAMSSLQTAKLDRALLISPIVDLEKLICDMMGWAGVTESELRSRREIPTDFGETLSWEYLCYVRNNPIKWDVRTDILYGEYDNMTSFETVTAFADKTGASLTVMKDGEHWFHTPEQLEFLDNWIKVKMRT